jgi:hypothetical protein
MYPEGRLHDPGTYAKSIDRRIFQEAQSEYEGLKTSLRAELETARRTERPVFFSVQTRIIPPK